MRVYKCLFKWSPGIRFCSHPILTALPKFCTLYFSFEFISQDSHKLFTITITRSVRTLGPVLFYRLSDFTGQAAQMTTSQLPPQPFHKFHTYSHVIKHASNTLDSQLSLAHITSAVQQLDHVNENHQTLLGCLFFYFYNLHQENLASSNRNNPTWFV